MEVKVPTTIVNFVHRSRGGRRKEEGGRRGRRRKEEGGRRKEEGETTNPIFFSCFFVVSRSSGAFPFLLRSSFPFSLRFRSTLFAAPSFGSVWLKK